MNKYKLIISDFDGTLAGREGIISKPVEDAIRRWRESGGEFSIATGRQYAMIQAEVEKLGITTPQITRGGAEIVDPKTRDVIYSKLMDVETVQRFIRKIEEHGYDYLLEHGNNLFGTREFNHKTPNVNHHPVSDFEMKSLPKIVVFLEEEKLREADMLLDEVLIKEFPTLHIVRSYSPLGKVWDVTSLAATKHLATLELMQLIEVTREETVGVGDGYNDFSLMEACGYKVAMGNAPEELKAIADIVVPGYKEDGVAVLIDKLLAEEEKSS